MCIDNIGAPRPGPAPVFRSPPRPRVRPEATRSTARGGDRDGEAVDCRARIRRRICPCTAAARSPGSSTPMPPSGGARDHRRVAHRQGGHLRPVDEQSTMPPRGQVDLQARMNGGVAAVAGAIARATASPVVTGSTRWKRKAGFSKRMASTVRSRIRIGVGDLAVGHRRRARTPRARRCGGPWRARVGIQIGPADAGTRPACSAAAGRCSRGWAWASRCRSRRRGGSGCAGTRSSRRPPRRRRSPAADSARSADINRAAAAALPNAIASRASGARLAVGGGVAGQHAAVRSRRPGRIRPALERERLRRWLEGFGVRLIVLGQGPLAFPQHVAWWRSSPRAAWR